MSAGQIAAKEASKAAMKEPGTAPWIGKLVSGKELAAHAKKVARKDLEWAKGAKDTSKNDEDALKSAEAVKAKAEKKALEAKEGGPSASGGSAAMKKCKDCKNMYNINSKKGCEHCTALLFGGAVPDKKKK
ncbi:hypothetical protein M885DRAFT_564462 [Pelagophyceae sp. CCMP2097]|nr:hypothetical protein M885DRAFT_564462 [Pelagophyceae sp. CCMP2097]